jgi:hypothetical protein
MATKSDPPRRRTPPMRYEGAAALVPLPLGELAPFVDSGGVAVDDGEGDEAVGVVGLTDDGEGDEALGVGGVADDGDRVGEGDGALTLLFVVVGDGAGDGDGAVPLLFEVAAAPTVIASFMPAEQ